MKMQPPAYATLAVLILSVALVETARAESFARARQKMVAEDIRGRGIADPRVLQAMTEVPRHLFVPVSLRKHAYADRPLPIGEGQTISQPYIVALMTESLGLEKSDKVLEIGTGSGYQAAILSKIAAKVFTIEIKEGLYNNTRKILGVDGYANVSTKRSDGYYGWEAEAPFDGVMITAAVDHIPPPLLKQLKNGGRLVLPLGNPFSYQQLVQVTRVGDNYTVRQITGVLFVPMTGNALEAKKSPH